MLCIIVYVFQGSHFHNLSGIHNRNLVAGVRNNAEVMRDQQHCGAQLFLQVAHKLQHLRLDGDIQRGCRLIRDDKLRAACKRNGDDNALLHAAGKLVRIF